MSVLPEAVCWHEGMQLLPQHFQPQGLRAEALAGHLAGACNPWFWGVETLEVDPAALCAGRVRVTALEAILPDGLPVSLGAAADGAPLELDLAEALAGSAASVTVYLAVTPLGRAGQLLPLNGRLRSVVGDALPDLASGEHPEPVVVWRPNPRLVTAGGRADSVCIPLLRVGREGGGYVRLPYVAPTPRILPESPLGGKVQALCGRAREKCVFLAGRLRQAQQAGNAEDAAELRLQLAALWARLPEVEAALNGRSTDPATLHRLLAGMAGSWCALDPLAGVPAFRPLAFEDLQRGYDEVLDWLAAALARIRAGYRSLPFEQDRHGFHIRLPDREQPRQRLVIGLRMPVGAGEQAARDWLAQSIVAAEAHVATLARQRMGGLSWQPMSRQEQVAYGVGEDTRIFVLQAAGEWFDPRQALRIVPCGSAAGGQPWQVVLFADAVDG
ncbi:type VI secretion system baseplate subunit TssK [Azotobacter chroococcum]|uniref:Type VI secretion system baseplate subunit TssK n=1 Tax=Azotobacter chroococcum TaxID=353 RepID=A0AA43Z685_9GAMM|nr:type VI secretion system baseplate subunit TssK [Azotobacter chroococcum]NHN76981.1 type VI secretion system baseplate subunit TssK [Azotobacter chroococcum]